MNQSAMRKKELTKFFNRYDAHRPHPGLDDSTPDGVYLGALPKMKDAVRNGAANT